MAVTFAFVSHKGGVGKSTITALLAWRLADKGQPLLAVDFDPQGSLTFLLTDQPLPEGAASLRLFKGQPVTPFPISDNLSLLGSDISLARVEGQKSQKTLQMAASALRQTDAPICLLDTPTGIHRPLTIAALLAADAFIVPVDPSPLSVVGLVDFLNTLDNFRERYGKEPKFLGVVLNLAESHTLVTQRIQRLLERLLGKERLLSVIPKRTRLREIALTRRLPNDLSVLEGVEALAKAVIKWRGDKG